MNLSLINPYIRLAIESKIPAGNNIAQRVIYDYELICLEKGSFSLIYDGSVYKCRAGDIIFIRPGISHSFVLDDGDISQPHIHFDITHRPQSSKIPISFKDISQMTERDREQIHKDYFLSYAPSPLINIKNREEFYETFYGIVSGEHEELMKKSLMIKLIAAIIRDNYPELLQGEEQARVVSQVKDYIDAGNGMGMTLDDFAKTFFYDKFYLERKFKEAYGQSLIEYRNKRRMELSRDLLKVYSVSRVAELSGYRSIYSFSRAYKSFFGHSPSKS